MTNAEIHAQALKDADLPYAPSAMPCPKCRMDCPCAHWEEVDIGVGIQVGDQQWVCLEHGLFGYNSNEGLVLRDEPPTGGPRTSRIIDTDNFGGDYPDEKFVLWPMRRESAEQIAAILNADAGEHARRYYRVVDDGYVLVPGFEP